MRALFRIGPLATQRVCRRISSAKSSPPLTRHFLRLSDLASTPISSVFPVAVAASSTTQRLLTHIIWRAATRTVSSCPLRRLSHRKKQHSKHQNSIGRRYAVTSHSAAMKPRRLSSKLQSIWALLQQMFSADRQGVTLRALTSRSFCLNRFLTGAASSISAIEYLFQMRTS